MEGKTCTVINILYKIFCTISLLSMVIYWIFKFIKDEDLCLVDYKLYKQAEEEDLPTFTLCINSPFIEERISRIDNNLNSSHYINYLQGNDNEISENIKKVAYNDVTVNVKDDITRIIVTWRNGSQSEFSYNDPLNPVRVFTSLNAFFYNGFMKCFGHEILQKYKKNVNGVSFYYTIDSELGNFMRKPLGNVFSTFQYSKQILRNPSPFSLIRTEISTTLTFKINTIEILKRRHKGSNPCEKAWRCFDEIIAKEHLKHRKCRPPYLEHDKTYPVCNTTESMKNSIYHYFKVRNEFFSTPCQAMTKIDFTFTDHIPFFLPKDDEFGISVQYPEEYKVITQSQAVDSHSLIGNIGGYIGLFLGKEFN